MTAVTETTWTCDRCRTQKVMAHGSQPDGWGGLERFEPPLSSEHYEFRKHLCNKCAAELSAWLGTTSMDVAP